jgi:hypothetical protein
MGALLTAAATPSDAATRPPPRSAAFDGLWSVSIYTQTGSCPASIRYPIRIYGGQLLPAEANPDYQIAGAVAASGAIGVTVASHGQNATGYGRLTRTQGSGSWRTQYGDCTGIWQAVRR